MNRTVPLVDLIPDTTDAPCPRYEPYAAALWLAGRHRRLRRLLDRVPAVLSRDRSGRVWIEIETLAEAFAQLDRRAASKAARPPRLSSAGHDIAVMSGGERTCLRMLAVLAPGGANVTSDMFDGLDDEGLRLARDWTNALISALDSTL